MFESGFPYSKLNKTKTSSIGKDILLFRHWYKFKTPKNVYLVWVEEYENDVLIIKFFLSSHQLSDRKFSFMSNEGLAPRIIGTCVDILINEFMDRKHYSVGFVGNAGEEEDTENTQRYRIYKQLVINSFSPISFLHICNINRSAYFLINKKKDVQQIKNLIDDQFNLRFESSNNFEDVLSDDTYINTSE